MRHVLSRAAAAALLAGTVACAPALSSAGRVEMRAAGGPFQVLVPALEVRGGLPAAVGAGVAGRVRSMLSGLATHQPVSMDAVELAKQRYGLVYLDSVTAPQLAKVLGAQLSGWGIIEPGARGLRADVWFVDLRNGDRIELQGLTAVSGGELAKLIFSNFQRQAEGLFQAAVCSDQLAGQEYELALKTCSSAVDHAPMSGSALYGRATALMHLERYDEALPVYEKLLRYDLSRRDALLNAGLTASHMGRGDEALGYYRRYLELGADDSRLVRAISARIAQTGDQVSAYRVLEPVLHAPENREDPAFQRYLFSLSMAAAQKLREAGDPDGATPFLETALDAHERMGDADVAGGEPAVLRQVITANNLLGRREDALRLAADATARYSDIPDVWIQYAALLSEAQRHAEAAAALTRVAELDPSFQGLFLRRALAYLQDGKREQALEDLDRAATQGDAEGVASILYREGVVALRADRFDEAAELLEKAHGHADQDRRAEISFYWGFALYKQGESIARANGGASAGRARAALGYLERALPLVQASTNPSAAQVLNAAQLYIANQHAIIRSGRR